MKIIKLYSKYFLSFSNVIIISLFEIFLIISYIVSIENLNSNLGYDEVLSFYFQNSIYYTKIILILFSGFSFMKLCNERNEYVLNIVITSGYSKKSNYKYMIICNIIILFFLVYISLFSFLIIGYFSKSYFLIKKEYLIAFLNIFLLAIYYGLFSYLLSLLFNNQFVYITIIILFFVSELFVNDESVFKYIYLYFFPNMENTTGLLYVHSIYLLFIIVLFYVINKYIYLKKDLRN